MEQRQILKATEFSYGTEEVIAKDGFTYLIDLDDIPKGFIGAYITRWGNGNEMFYSNNRIAYSREYISHRVVASNNPRLSHLPTITPKPSTNGKTDPKKDYGRAM